MIKILIGIVIGLSLGWLVDNGTEYISNVYVELTPVCVEPYQLINEYVSKTEYVGGCYL